MDIKAHIYTEKKCYWIKSISFQKHVYHGFKSICYRISNIFIGSCNIFLWINSVHAFEKKCFWFNRIFVSVYQLLELHADAELCARPLLQENWFCAKLLSESSNESITEVGKLYYAKDVFLRKLSDFAVLREDRHARSAHKEVPSTSDQDDETTPVIKNRKWAKHHPWNCEFCCCWYTSWVSPSRRILAASRSTPLVFSQISSLCFACQPHCHFNRLLFFFGFFYAINCFTSFRACRQKVIAS